MAMYHRVPMPERPRGTPEQEIERTYRYLWQLAEILNMIIDQLEKEAKRNGTDRA